MNTKIKNPYKFKKQAILIIVVFCFLVLSPVQKVWASDITAGSVIQLVNKDRLAQGLGMLTENSLLSSAAQEKLNDMIKKNYFAHTSPSGISPWHWIEKSGYDYQYAGENLAVNFTSAEDQHKAWMASATHRKNILNSNYKEIGVAVAQGSMDGHTSIIAVQFFGTQSGAATSSKNAEPEKQGVKGEESPELIALKPQILPFLSDKKILNNVSLNNLNIRQPQCANGLCYFSEANSLLYKMKRNSDKAAWVLVVLILILSIVINTTSLSRERNHNPFIAANTVILLLILTGVVFWRV